MILIDAVYPVRPPLSAMPRKAAVPPASVNACVTPPLMPVAPVNGLRGSWWN